MKFLLQFEQGNVIGFEFEKSNSKFIFESSAPGCELEESIDGSDWNIELRFLLADFESLYLNSEIKNNVISEKNYRKQWTKKILLNRFYSIEKVFLDSWYIFSDFSTKIYTTSNPKQSRALILSIKNINISYCTIFTKICK